MRDDPPLRADRLIVELYLMHDCNVRVRRPKHQLPRTPVKRTSLGEPFGIASIT